MEYLDHDGENAIETLRKLIYDFLSAENAIIEAKQCNNIVEWTRTVVDGLMVLYKPRTWCAFCPMGTMTQGICKLKNNENK